MVFRTENEISTTEQKKIITVNEFYQSLFHTKTYKLSLDSGCTCPTRDGKLDTRGCIFCNANGSGDFCSKTIEEAKKLVSKKLKNPNDAKYIAYFQNFTNTYGDLKSLSEKWENALNCENVVGLALGTRPDCISKECLEYLGQLAEKTFVQIELGLQTSNLLTAEYIRRHFSNEVYQKCISDLHNTNKNIHIVTHIILGLPGESKDDMMNSLRFAIESGTDGIKITNLYILKDTDLEKEFENGKIHPLEAQEYFELLKEAIKIIPEEIIIHRLTGDPPKALLIEPKWSMNKKWVINKIKELSQPN